MKVIDVKPGMTYQNLLIIAVEFFGNIAKLYFIDSTTMKFAKDSYLLIDVSIVIEQ